MFFFPVTLFGQLRDPLIFIRFYFYFHPHLECFHSCDAFRTTPRHVDFRSFLLLFSSAFGMFSFSDAFWTNPGSVDFQSGSFLFPPTTNFFGKLVKIVITKKDLNTNQGPCVQFQPPQVHFFENSPPHVITYCILPSPGYREWQRAKRKCKS